MNKKVNNLALVSVMLCFFAMGFVDLVGIASNYVKKDLGLNDATANVFPSLVFFWFLIFSVHWGIDEQDRKEKDGVALPGCHRHVAIAPCFR